MSDDLSLATVLVAQSDPQLRHLFQLLLRPHYTIIEAPTRALALETLRTHSEPLVVVWDLWLSRMMVPHVLDAIEQEPALRRHAFILVASDPEAFSSAVRRRAQRLGVPVIGMPFDVDEFLEQMARAREHATANRQAAD